MRLLRWPLHQRIGTRRTLVQEDPDGLRSGSDINKHTIFLHIEIGVSMRDPSMCSSLFRRTPRRTGSDPTGSDEKGLEPNPVEGFFAMSMVQLCRAVMAKGLLVRCLEFINPKPG